MFYVLQFSCYYEFKLRHVFPNYLVHRASFLRPPSYVLSGAYQSCANVTCFIWASVAVGRHFNAASEKYFSWGNVHTFSHQKFLKLWPPNPWPNLFFLFLFPLHVRCFPYHDLFIAWSTSYIVKGVDNVEKLYSCLTIEGKILDHWTN